MGPLLERGRFQRQRQRQRPAGRRAWLVLTGAFVSGLVFALGCAQIIGANEDYEALPLQIEEAGVNPNPNPSFEAGEAPPDDGGLLPCPANQKRCGGACVPMKVENGCGSAKCEPCSLPNTATQVCRDGACTATTCNAGFGACGEPKDGCKADFTSPKTCLECLKACNVDAGQVCSPTGCGADCGSLTNCEGACVDTQTSAAHCGSCPTACPTGENSDPKCAAGECSLVCRPGFAHCDGNAQGTCVALTTFYRDVDGDSYGVSTMTKTACDQAAAGVGWAAKSGDCHDGDPNVHPNANGSSTPYTAVGGQKSYDYDCNGIEQEQFMKYMGCAPGTCSGGGYGLAYSGRAGAGVNDFCGGPVKACSSSVPGAYPYVFENGCYVFTPVSATGACK